MLRYIARRIIASLFILWVVSVLVFALMNVLPGDPLMRGMGALQMSREDLVSLREARGLNRPLPVQYGDWIFHALQGDLGTTVAGEYSINRYFERRVPATMELGVLSLLVVITVAIPVGVLTALRPGSRTEVTASTLMIVGSSIPEFLTGIALIIVVGLELGWFPILGYVPFGRIRSRTCGTWRCR